MSKNIQTEIVRGLQAIAQLESKIKESSQAFNWLNFHGHLQDWCQTKKPKWTEFRPVFYGTQRVLRTLQKDPGKFKNKTKHEDFIQSSPQTPHEHEPAKTSEPSEGKSKSAPSLDYAKHHRLRLWFKGLRPFTDLDQPLKDLTPLEKQLRFRRARRIYKKFANPDEYVKGMSSIETAITMLEDDTEEKRFQGTLNGFSQWSIQGKKRGLLRHGFEGCCQLVKMKFSMWHYRWGNLRFKLQSFYEKHNAHRKFRALTKLGKLIFMLPLKLIFGLVRLIGCWLHDILHYSLRVIRYMIPRYFHRHTLDHEVLGKLNQIRAIRDRLQDDGQKDPFLDDLNEFLKGSWEDRHQFYEAYNKFYWAFQVRLLDRYWKDPENNSHYRALLDEILYRDVLGYYRLQKDPSKDALLDPYIDCTQGKIQDSADFKRLYKAIGNARLKKTLHYLNTHTRMAGVALNVAQWALPDGVDASILDVMQIVKQIARETNDQFVKDELERLYQAQAITEFDDLAHRVFVKCQDPTLYNGKDAHNEPDDEIDEAQAAIRKRLHKAINRVGQAYGLKQRIFNIKHVIKRVISDEAAEDIRAIKEDILNMDATYFVFNADTKDDYQKDGYDDEFKHLRRRLEQLKQGDDQVNQRLEDYIQKLRNIRHQGMDRIRWAIAEERRQNLRRQKKRLNFRNLFTTGLVAIGEGGVAAQLFIAAFPALCLAPMGWFIPVAIFLGGYIINHILFYVNGKVSQHGIFLKSEHQYDPETGRILSPFARSFINASLVVTFTAGITAAALSFTSNVGFLQFVLGLIGITISATVPPVWVAAIAGLITFAAFIGFQRLYHYAYIETATSLHKLKSFAGLMRAIKDAAVRYARKTFSMRYNYDDITWDIASKSLKFKMVLRILFKPLIDLVRWAIALLLPIFSSVVEYTLLSDRTVDFFREVFGATGKTAFALGHAFAFATQWLGDFIFDAYNMIGFATRIQDDLSDILHNLKDREFKTAFKKLWGFTLIKFPIVLLGVAVLPVLLPIMGLAKYLKNKQSNAEEQPSRVLDCFDKWCTMSINFLKDLMRVALLANLVGVSMQGKGYDEQQAVRNMTGLNGLALDAASIGSAGSTSYSDNTEAIEQVKDQTVGEKCQNDQAREWEKLDGKGESQGSKASDAKSPTGESERICNLLANHFFKHKLGTPQHARYVVAQKPVPA